MFTNGNNGRDLARKYTTTINDVVSKWMCKQSNDAETAIFDEIFRDDDDILSLFWCKIYAEDDEDENTEQSFNELIKIINQKNKLLMPVKGMVIAHTPQFMDNKYLIQSIMIVWQIDVGMSRAFGKHDECKE